MSICSDVSDYKWLTGDEARPLLDELAEDSAPLHTAVARLRGRFSPTRTHLLVEQVELRRRAAAKFTNACRMFFTRVGLEQATDEWVAAHKATRFAELVAAQRAGSVSARSAPVLADLCSGIGGDLMALAKISSAFGVELNPVAAHFAATNSGATVRTSDVAQFDFADVDAWHIDPDRRPHGERTTSLEYCEPNLATMERLLDRVPHAAVKLAPAARVPPHWADHCELEWMSRDRQCRQLVAWHGDLARSPGLSRATILSAAGHSAPSSWPRGGLAHRTLAGTPNQMIPLTLQLDRYVFDVDPAVVAAHLTGALAAEYNLKALATGPTYLTGPSAIDDAALAAFDVQEVLPLKLSQLAAHLRERSIGQLEIKKRGIDIDPEKLRRDLKLRGNNAATLLVAHVANRPTAILAHRIAARD